MVSRAERSALADWWWTVDRWQLVALATLIVLGTFGAARSAAREDWRGLGLSIAFLLVAAGSAFAGPRGVWLSDGVGCCVVLLGYSAAQAWQLRGSRSDV